MVRETQDWREVPRGELFSRVATVLEDAVVAAQEDGSEAAADYIATVRELEAFVYDEREKALAAE